MTFYIYGEQCVMLTAEGGGRCVIQITTQNKPDTFKSFFKTLTVCSLQNVGLCIHWRNQLPRCVLSVQSQLLIELCWCVIVNNTTSCNTRHLLLLQTPFSKKLKSFQKLLELKKILVFLSFLLTMLPMVTKDGDACVFNTSKEVYRLLLGNMLYKCVAIQCPHRMN